MAGPDFYVEASFSQSVTKVLKYSISLNYFVYENAKIRQFCEGEGQFLKRLKSNIPRTVQR